MGQEHTKCSMILRHTKMETRIRGVLLKSTLWGLARCLGCTSDQCLVMQVSFLLKMVPKDVKKGLNEGIFRQSPSLKCVGIHCDHALRCVSKFEGRSQALLRGIGRPKRVVRQRNPTFATRFLLITVASIFQSFPDIEARLPQSPSIKEELIAKCRPHEFDFQDTPTSTRWIPI
jgi:hypothetical protein